MTFGRAGARASSFEMTAPRSPQDEAKRHLCRSKLLPHTPSLILRARQRRASRRMGRRATASNAIALVLSGSHVRRSPALNSSRDESACRRLRREKRPSAPAANLDSHFIDRSCQSLDIYSIENCSSSRSRNMRTDHQRNLDDMHACMTRRCFSAATGACCCC